jgi:hypothetical protein
MALMQYGRAATTGSSSGRARAVGTWTTPASSLRAGDRGVARRQQGRLALAALVLNGLVASAAAVWLSRPGRYPRHLQLEQVGSLLSLVDPTLASAGVFVLGLLGVGLALDHRRPGSRSPAWPAAVLAAVFTLLLPDLTLLMTLGYSLAVIGPVTLLVVLTAASTRRPSLRWCATALASAFVVLVLALVLSADFAEVTRQLGSALSRSGVGMLMNVTAIACGLTWGALAVRSHRARWWGERPATTTWEPPRRDWGWWATVLAALCPLPYALARLSWLTPWPVLTSGVDVGADPVIRVIGICLGLAALGGTALTLGLLARWGTVYPRWVPGVGGRAVPAGWPTMIAIGVGLAITVAGRALAQVLLRQSGLELAAADVLLLLAFPVWGPALVIAAVSYHQRRHPTS